MKKWYSLETSGNKTKVLRYLVSGTGLMLAVTVLAGVILASPITRASTTETGSVSVIVNSACTITTGGGSYSKTIAPGTTDTVTGNGINVTCNDSNGYALYAVGYSGDSYDTSSNTRMIAVSGSSYIPTATSGSDSYWAMKVAGSSDISTTPTIDNSYDDYNVIPSAYTKISHYTGSTIGTTTNSVTTPTYEVYVSSSQAAGTYTGKVKYSLVHPQSVDAATAMQNWTGCSDLAVGSSTFLQDTRDGQFYNVIKYNDGQCWMTTNLNIAGGTALSATDTDVDSDYISNFETSNNLTKSGSTIVLPESSTTGFDTDNYAYVYNSGREATSDSGCSSPGCWSYYSWDAATLGSGREITADNTDAAYSICPKGWHLPNTRTGTNDTADFRKLMIVLGGSSSIATYTTSTSPTGATIFSGLSSAPLSFLRAGDYYGSTFYNGGSNGRYWSATSYSSTLARYLYFNSSNVYSAHNDNRRDGISVRCIADS